MMKHREIGDYSYVKKLNADEVKDDIEKAREILDHKRLNPYAHYRNKELPLNYRLDLEIYLGILQNIMTSILDMKSKLYIESESII